MDRPVITISNLSKSFDTKHIFRNFNMRLENRENLVVLGRSGVGKSVLLKCITGLMEPDSGLVTVFDKNIKDLKEAELNRLRSRMGYLFQSGALYDSMTIYENLLFPLKRNKHLNLDKDDGIIIESLNNVGLTDTKDLMPSELSGGMKKRAGLARTLVMQPEIILYDEPTTGLDPFTAREISELILSVREKNGNSSVVVTHDMTCARIVADRIIIIDKGENIGEGTYEDLASSKDPKIKQFFRNN